jgi:hypothetical protein
MSRAIVVALLTLVVACGVDSSVPGGQRDLSFRAISEKQNSELCVREPSFAVALTPERWRDAWRRGTGCQSGVGEAPPLRRDEAGVAAWWEVEGCLGYQIHTTEVRYEDGDVVVRAASVAPAAEFCATGLGGLESYLALDAAVVSAANNIRFELDGAAVGSVPVPA